MSVLSYDLRSTAYLEVHLAQAWMDSLIELLQYMLVWFDHWTILQRIIAINFLHPTISQHDEQHPYFLCYLQYHPSNPLMSSHYLGH